MSGPGASGKASSRGRRWTSPPHGRWLGPGITTGCAKTGSRGPAALRRRSWRLWVWWAGRGRCRCDSIGSMDTALIPSRTQIEDTAERIAPHVRRTPVLEVQAGTFGVGAPLVLKLELLQVTGSFKPRGAFNRMLTAQVGESGVVGGERGELRPRGGSRRARAGPPCRDLRAVHVAGVEDRPGASHGCRGARGRGLLRRCVSGRRRATGSDRRRVDASLRSARGGGRPGDDRSRALPAGTRRRHGGGERGRRRTDRRDRGLVRGRGCGGGRRAR